MTKPEARDARRIVRHSSFPSASFRNSTFEFRILPGYEFPCAYCFRLRRCVARGNSVLSSQAEAGRETGVQHLALAKVSGRDPGQRAFSTVAQELAADSAAHFADDGRVGARSAVLQNS